MAMKTNIWLSFIALNNFFANMCVKKNIVLHQPKASPHVTVMTTPAPKSELSKMRRKKFIAELHDLYVAIRPNGGILKNFFLIELDESECCRHFP